MAQTSVAYLLITFFIPMFNTGFHRVLRCPVSVVSDLWWLCGHSSSVITLKTSGPIICKCSAVCIVWCFLEKRKAVDLQGESERGVMSFMFLPLSQSTVTLPGSTACTHHILLFCLPVDGHAGWLHFQSGKLYCSTQGPNTGQDCHLTQKSTECQCIS